MALVPNITRVNDNSFITALSGGGGGSAISTFTTASISSLSVSSVNGFQANDLLTSDWATFPAVNTINANNFGINYVQEIDGIPGEPLIINGFTTTIQGGGVNGMTIGTTGNILVNNNLTIQGNTVGGSANFASVNASTITANTLIALSTVNVVSTISTTVVDAQSIITDKLAVNYGEGSFAVDTDKLSGAGGAVLSAPTGNASIYLASKSDGNNQYLSMGIGANATNASIAYNSSGIPKGGMAVYDDLTTFGLGSAGGISLYAQGQLSNTFITTNGINTSNISTIFLTASNINLSSINGNELLISTIIVDSNLIADSGQFQQLTATAFSTLGAEIKQGLFSSIVFNPSINPTFNISVDTGFTSIGAGLGSIGAGLLALAVSLPVAGYELGYGLGKGLNSATEPRQINNINNNVYESYNYASQLQISTLGQQFSTIFRTISTIPSTIMDLNMSTLATSTNIEIFTSTISAPPPVLAIRAVADPLQFVSTPWSYEQGFGQWVEIPSGGLSSNISTLSLSTLTLTPSTILKGDLPNTLEILGNDGQYNEVVADAFVVSGAPGDPNNGAYTVNVSNKPLYIDSNFSSFTFALNNTPATFSKLAVSNNNPLIVQSQDLDAWGVLQLSTLAGDDRRVDIINTQNDGSIVFSSAPSAPGGTTLSTSLILAGSANSVIIGGGYTETTATLNVVGSISSLSLAVSGNASANSVVATNGNFSNISTNSVAIDNANGTGLFINTGTIPSSGPYSLFDTDRGSLTSYYLELAPVGIKTILSGIDTNSSYQNQNAVVMFPQHSTIGIYDFNPNPAYKLNVGGGVSASNIVAPSATFSNATISSLTQQVAVDSIPQPGCGLVALHNWDYFTSSWGHYQGKQPVIGGYFINTSNSIGSGAGYGTFLFPPGGISSLQTLTATYTNNSSNTPNHPTWYGNQTTDANGQISTIQVFGDDGVDISVSYIGLV